MRKITILFILISALSVDAIGQKKKLVWADEFNKGVLSTASWGYEEGKVRNNEPQYYTKEQRNAYVEKGCLVIKTIKEDYKGSKYTSASVNTLGKVSFEGDFLIEVRAKLPYGKGIWPAIWLMGDDIETVNWPKCCEFDVMEFWGGDPGYTYSRIHYYDTASKASYSSTPNDYFFKSQTLHTKFHVYAMERKGSVIKILVDGQVIQEFTAPNDNARKEQFTNPLYLLLNTAVTSGEDSINDDIFPQNFHIDYVRYYKIY